jgi:16S rRNA processing protein RimM
MTAPQFILVAQIGGAFGVKGEVKITTFTQTAQAVLKYKDLLDEHGAPALTLVSGRAAKAGLVARAKEITTPEQADAMRGRKLYIPRERLPAPDEDEFYLADLIGLAVHDPDGALIGKIKAVQNFGADDLLEIDPADGGPSWWLAFTLEAVPVVDIAGGRVVAVRPIEVGDRGTEI